MHSLDIIADQPFGISSPTTWSMVKLAALARGGNSLKVSNHFMRMGGAAYWMGIFSRNQVS